MSQKKMFLVAEFCSHWIYNGWHLYLRDTIRRQHRNLNGEWGWLRRSNSEGSAHAVLASLGIAMRGDGSCDDDGYAELARRYPVGRQRVGGKPRGAVPVLVDEYGHVTADPDFTLGLPAMESI